METVVSSALEWSWAGAAMPGCSGSGDRHLVKEFSGGVLMAVMDGLGHGEQAAAAADAASEVLARNPGENVIPLVMQCHARLKGTRGVALSLASIQFAGGLLSWIGVGNVQGVLLRSNSHGNNREEALLLRAGVVGSHLPALQAAVLPIFPGDSLVFATDGVDSDFDRARVRTQSPVRVAESLLAQYARGKDDALVFVGRYKGMST